MKTKNKLLVAGIALCMLAFNAVAQTTEIKGLTVMVEYQDKPFPEPEDSVTMMMNQTGFNSWGNIGSVKDFYYTQSNGKVILTSTVIKVTLPHALGYYRNNEYEFENSDIVDAINQKYPAGFTNLTLRSDNSLAYLCLLTKAGGGGWSFNPQKGNNIIKNNGQNVIFGIGNITNYDNATQKPENATICHETGHSLMGWPDQRNIAWSNIGNYCLMGTGLNTVNTVNPVGPMPANPAFRLKKGWIDNVITIGNTTQTYTAVSNSYNTIYKYDNPNNPKEYLLIHPQVYGGYYRQYLRGDNIADQGLAIYYVDEDGGDIMPGSRTDLFIKLMQADNLDEMHPPYAKNYQVNGDFDDLYDNIKNSFPNGTPFRWKDGGEFGLNITNISAPGSTMTFTVNGRPNTINALSDINGKVSPSGIIGVANGAAKTFTFIPLPGYELNTVKVDGVTVTASNNQYTFPSVSGTKKLEVTFKRKTTLDPLPSPWQHADIGTASVSGISGHTNGQFYLESSGWDIWGGSDHFRFVYQSLTGDGSIEAKLIFANKPQDWSKVGIMIRENLQPDAALSMIALTPSNSIRLQQRATAGANMTDNPDNITTEEKHKLYRWYKITRVGNVIASYISPDRKFWMQLAQETIPMSSQVYVGMAATGASGSITSRVIFDSVTVSSNSTVCSFAGSKLSGTVLGTPGSYQNEGNTREKAFDSDPNSFFDHDASIAWAGLDLVSNYKISGIKFIPRAGLESRSIGGKFQGSNTADFSSGVTDLATITEAYQDSWNCVSVSNTAGFRYVRYISPSGGYGNIAEIQFFGASSISNTPPTVNITSPASNSSFVTPTNIVIDAAATDADGSITKVDFYNGSTLLGSDLTAPYTYIWNNVPTGVYNITAFAIDNLGASSSSTRNNIAVIGNTAPTISITSPVTNQNFAAPANITITTDVTDAENNITKVDFYNGSTLLGSDLTAPYSYTWNNVPVGVYNITALVIDSQNATASSTRNNIAVIANQAPTISITSPITNQSFTAPTNITITTDVTDAENNITKVDFYNGSTLLGSDLTAPYSYTWSNVPVGVYNITALVIDSQNATASSTRNNIAVVASAADITGPTCANNNQTLTYELAPSKRVNANSYGWYFTGSTQSFNPSGYQATLVTGSNYGAGQLCVGVSLNAAPWYTTYCINVPKCSSSGARMAETLELSESTETLSATGFPNPFESEVTLSLPIYSDASNIEVFSTNGNKVHEAKAVGSYTFGNEFKSGIYFVKISSSDKTETIKVVKK